MESQKIPDYSIEGPIEKRISRVMVWLLIWKKHLTTWINRDVARSIAHMVHNEVVLLDKVAVDGKKMILTTTLKGLFVWQFEGEPSVTYDPCMTCIYPCLIAPCRGCDRHSNARLVKLERYFDCFHFARQKYRLQICFSDLVLGTGEDLQTLFQINAIRDQI